MLAGSSSAGHAMTKSPARSPLGPASVPRTIMAARSNARTHAATCRAFISLASRVVRLCWRNTSRVQTQLAERLRRSVQCGKIHPGIIGREDDPLPARPIRREDATSDDVRRTSRLTLSRPRGIDADTHVHIHPSLDRSNSRKTLTIDVGVRIKATRNNLIPWGFVEVQKPVHAWREVLRRYIAQDRHVPVRHLLRVHPSGLVLIGDRFDPVAPSGHF